jgi:hypothetical protein
MKVKLYCVCAKPHTKQSHNYHFYCVKDYHHYCSAQCFLKLYLAGRVKTAEDWEIIFFLEFPKLCYKVVFFFKAKCLSRSLAIDCVHDT